MFFEVPKPESNICARLDVYIFSKNINCKYINVLYHGIVVCTGAIDLKSESSVSISVT